jgi:GNAT superfamily N-acetyltransferase
MIPDHTVIELQQQDEAEAMEIIITAFHDAPQVPALIKKPQETKTVIQSLAKLYKKTDTVKTFGIKKDNVLICVGLCIDSDAKPGYLSTLIFGFSLARSLGLKGAYQFWVYKKTKPTYEKKCLELLFYGTKKTYQKKGYGRVLLNFLYEYAKKNNYEGVTGVTNTSRPAFSFYMKEGWSVDTEFMIDSYRICWVRRHV